MKKILVLSLTFVIVIVSCKSQTKLSVKRLTPNQAKEGWYYLTAKQLTDGIAMARHPPVNRYIVDLFSFEQRHQTSLPRLRQQLTDTFRIMP